MFNKPKIKNMVSFVALILAIIMSFTSCGPELKTTLEGVTSHEDTAYEVLNVIEPTDDNQNINEGISSNNNNSSNNNSSNNGTSSEESNTTVVNTIYTFESKGLTQPKVKVPATIYFGTYKFMEQLTNSSNSWSFVKRNADGILLHGAYWLNQQSISIPVGKKLAQILYNTEMDVMVEMGWPDPGLVHDETLPIRCAQNHVNQIKSLQAGTGLKVDEFSVDWYGHTFTNLRRDNPTWTEDQIYAEAIRYFGEYYKVINENFPDARTAITAPPVYFSFNGYQPAAFQWDGDKLYPAVFELCKNYVGKPLLGFNFDSPYNYIVESQNHRNVIGEFETWLQSNGYHNSFLVNTGSVKTSNEAEFDEQYCRESFQCVQLIQQIGRRPNRYNIESWYAGPYQLVPETKENTFTNMVMKVIKYIKGIGQNLDIQIGESDQKLIGEDIYASSPNRLQTIEMSGNSKKYTISVVNNGEVVSYPMLRAVSNVDSGVTVKYFYNGEDITSQIISEDGFCFENILMVGASAEIEMQISKKNSNSKGNISICGFYNPQDPTNTIKDVVSVEF